MEGVENVDNYLTIIKYTPVEQGMQPPASRFVNNLSNVLHLDDFSCQFFHKNRWNGENAGVGEGYPKG